MYVCMCVCVLLIKRKKSKYFKMKRSINEYEFGTLGFYLIPALWLSG